MIIKAMALTQEIINSVPRRKPGPKPKYSPDERRHAAVKAAMAWNERNREKKRVIQASYYERNREKILARSKEKRVRKRAEELGIDIEELLARECSLGADSDAPE